MPLTRARLISAILALTLVVGSSGVCRADEQITSPVEVIADVQAKIVKIFGAGGAQRLEGYQSGILVSGDGHVLTTFSYVLDDEEVTVVLNDGRRYDAQLEGADPLTGIAVLSLPHDGEALPHFRLGDAATADVGDRILAFSNLYRVATGNEPVSVQRGVVSTIAPLVARRGAAPVRFRDDVYILDAVVNNPGAAGGAIVNLHGQLIGMIGRELRSSVNNSWLNYALPVAAFKESFNAILSGRFVPPDQHATTRAENPHSLSRLGLVLVPDIVATTPPYVDAVRPGTAAEAADIRPDDMIVLIEDQLTVSRIAVEAILDTYEREDSLRITILRGGELIETTLENE